MKQLTVRIDASTHRGSEHYKLISPGLVRMQFQVASQCRGLNVGPNSSVLTSIAPVVLLKSIEKRPFSSRL